MIAPPLDGRSTLDSANAAVRAAEHDLERGEPLLAYNTVQSGLQQWPEHIRLRQLQALALARSGDIARANRILDGLVGEGVDDAETLGLLARTHKDLALRATDAPRRRSHLQAGFALYNQAYRAAAANDAAAAWYTGINAATMAVLLGDLEGARGLARETREICLHADDGSDSAASRYWRQATLGEAALILGESSVAATHYARAATLSEGRHGDVSSTRRQARLIAANLPGAGTTAIDALTIPPVLVFTGHMIDRPDRPAPRFPAALEARVRDAIRERLAKIAPLAAYGSAACGADILCLEATRELGGETHVVLPFPPAEFRRISVDLAPGWGERFDQALAAADSVTITSDHRAQGSVATFEYANLVLTGMGRLRAQLLDTTQQGLAIWDPNAPASAGGSASTLSLWDRLGLRVDRIDVRELRGDPAGVSPAAPDPSADPPAPGTRHEMRSMIFADAVGYSQLSEDQIPKYITGFLGAVAGLNRRTAHRFEHVETAGDGLYMVFREPSDAGHYALELSALVNASDWTTHGLPSNLNLRIALHSGPVHCGVDPITELPIYTGPHTSRTARIEPITPPGQVYASSAFAAVAAASGVESLAMSYVGRIPLAKSHGTLGLYSVHACAAVFA